jgi:succinate dehydrogenase/fumarate reductase flavoprotein subunit
MMEGYGCLKNKTIPKAKRDTGGREDYYLERRYPAFGNLVPRDVASRAAKERCDAGYGVGTSRQAVYLDYADAIVRYGKIEAGKQGLDHTGEAEIIAMGKKVVEEKYGNLSTCMKRSPVKILMKFQCVFILPCTIPWGTLGGLRITNNSARIILPWGS